MEDALDALEAERGETEASASPTGAATSPAHDPQSEEAFAGLQGADIASLKSLIDAHLRKTNVYAEIRSFVAAFAKEGGNKGDVLDTLRERRVIESVLESLETRKDVAHPASNRRAEGTFASLRQAVVRGEQYLHVKALGGRHFSEAKGHRYVLRIHYNDQRFESRPVPATAEPAMDAAFLVRLSKRFSLSAEPTTPFEAQARGLKRVLEQGHDDDSRRRDTRELFCPLHLLILRAPEEGIDGPSELVASHLLEWRRVLASGGATVAVELSGLGPTAKIRMPAGVLDLRLDLVPKPAAVTDDATPLPSAAQVDSALRREGQLHADAHRRFCQYARMWWQEYVETNPAFRQRLVKIFAENEWGEHAAACTFVQPLRAGRQLDSPQHAARFVSLIPYVREEVVGGGRMEVWHTTHSFLSKGQGDCEDHALLLCSLLLGFGLRAFVCVGTVRETKDAKERDHVWVATLAGKHGRSCTFWESLTGQRVEAPQRRDKEPHSYRRVACMFNHEAFFANKQADDRVVGCSFDLADDIAWKPMDERLLGALRRTPQAPLTPALADEGAVGDAIETALRGLIKTSREERFELTTSWDEDLAYYLTPALCAYETERRTGVLAGSAEFEQVVKHHIPAGHSFKGYPTLFNHRDPHRILRALERNPVAADILATRGDHTHMALRVRVFAFPERVCAVWVMLAVRSRLA